MMHAETEELTTAVAAPVSGANRLHDLWSRYGSLEHAALGAIGLLSLFLNAVGLSSEGYANTYYAAAVKSMSMNWHNFFFVSFDPAGFVSVDKPPLGLWLQVASAKLFGFSGWSLLLPQALAGVLSTIVLYRLVAQRFGYGGGLIAALSLALTPVAIVDNRNNTSDSVLILLLLLSAWAVSRAVESGHLRWLLLGAIFVGLGFNVKELEAFLILPPLLLYYLVGARQSLLSRIGGAIAAGFVTLLVSFSWIVAVDLTPASARPFVSDSGTNSELSLALGYNGFGRLATGLLSHIGKIPILNVRIDGTIVPGISMDIGNPGLFRLFRSAIGGQASWLLAIALIGLLAAALRPSSRFDARGERATLLLWGGWLLMAGIFFSVARFYHLYYLILLAPPVAALSGIGFARLWDDYRTSITGAGPRPWQGWALPLALVLGGWAQMQILSGYTSWNGWLGPAVLVLCIAVAVALMLGRLGVRFDLGDGEVVHLDRRVTLGVTIVGIVSLLITPTAFAADSIASGNGAAWLPQAGPSTGFGFGGPGGAGRGVFGGPPGGFGGGPSGGGTRTGTTNGRLPAAASGATGTNRSQGTFPGGGGFGGPGGGGGGGALTFAGSDVPTINAGLIRYLEAHRAGARYLVATPTSGYAALFILQTGQAVMTLGGYQGWDKILTLSQLKTAIARGEIRFFLISGTGNAGGPMAMLNGVDAGLNTINASLTTWVTSSCSVVQSSTYSTSSKVTTTTAGRGGFGSQGPGTLYDCRGAA